MRKPKNSYGDIRMKILNALMYDLYYLNDRVMQGDIVSAEKALPKANKLCQQAKQDLEASGEAFDVFLQAYAAHGGFIGVLVCYAETKDAITRIQYSQVPRRLKV